MTIGCTETEFCPDAFATRAELATFVARALGLPDATRDYFTDDEGLIHEADINSLAEAGITERLRPRPVLPERHGYPRRARAGSNPGSVPEPLTDVDPQAASSPDAAHKPAVPVALRPMPLGTRQPLRIPSRSS